MMRRAAIVLAMAVWSLPAHAGYPVETKVTCPVGGEKFTFVTTGSYSTFGERPDGKPYGSWTFPLALPECPSNHLVVYRGFKPEEVAPLTALVKSRDYKALKRETPYFRAAWLAERMDRTDPLAGPFLLLRATWETDGDPETKARYQRAFAAAASARPVDPADTASLILRYRLANAYRELGEAALASAALGALPMGALDVEVPTGDDVPYAVQSDAKTRRYLLGMIPRMRAAIAAGDTASEPLDLMDPDFVAGRCADMIEEDAAAPLPDHCNDPAIRKAADVFVARRRSADFADEMPKDAAED
ncbi:MAG: hypothetical protein ACKO1O_12345 [Erythrobacter sp.]